MTFKFWTLEHSSGQTQQQPWIGSVIHILDGQFSSPTEFPRFSDYFWKLNGATLLQKKIQLIWHLEMSIHNDLSWKGPSWLCQSESSWPPFALPLEIKLTKTPIVSVNRYTQAAKSIDAIFSSLQMMQRIIAQCLRIRSSTLKFNILYWNLIFKNLDHIL